MVLEEKSEKVREGEREKVRGGEREKLRGGEKEGEGERAPRGEEEEESIRLEKSNILLLGPTGSGEIHTYNWTGPVLYSMHSIFV